MSCDSPMMAVKGDLQESGKYKYKFIGRYTPETLKTHPDAIPIPCGHCVGCRLDYAKQWADRMVLEMDYSKKAVFVTCTYDEDNVPRVVDPDTGEAFMSLEKKDSAQFLKRIRNLYDKGTIRFYCSGEYGSLTKRPHLHYILFGIGLEDCGKLSFFSKNKFGCENYKCELFMKYWKKGNVIVSSVTWETCAYVARYNLKKLKGVLNEERSFIQPEFSTMSRRPGIGMHYFEQHPECFEYSNIPISGSKTLRKQSKKIVIPKAFINKLEDINPELYESLKMKRKKIAEDNMFSRLATTDISWLDIKEMEDAKRIKSNSFLDKDQNI